MLEILSKEQFFACRREPLLVYAEYRKEAENFIKRIPNAAQKLADESWLLDRDIADLDRLTQARTDYAIKLISLSYSAGANLQRLRDFFPIILQYYEEYALYNAAFNKKSNETQVQAPTICIQDVEFSIANRLLCFAVALGWGELVPRIMALIDYNNPVRDGMLERIASVYMHRPRPMPSECTRHLPYLRTLAIFTAEPGDRAAIMREYLQNWYEGSRREPYYDSHSKGTKFLGYWSWESAAITIALSMEDTTYHSMEFYPADLVAYFNRNASAFRNQTRPVDEIRAKAGELCPAGGLWESIGTPSKREKYDAGMPMSDLKSPYGWTVWRFLAPE